MVLDKEQVVSHIVTGIALILALGEMVYQDAVSDETRVLLYGLFFLLIGISGVWNRYYNRQRDSVDEREAQIRRISASYTLWIVFFILFAATGLTYVTNISGPQVPFLIAVLGFIIYHGIAMLLRDRM